MKFKEAYQQLNGHEPTPEKIIEFERTCAILETTHNDAFLSVLVALDHYQNLYSEIPTKINQSIETTLAGLHDAMDQQAAASVNAMKRNLIAIVATAVSSVASDVSRKQKWRWACASIIAAFVSTGTFGWYMHQAGLKDGLSLGYANGYQTAKDEKSAASWANTNEGKIAFRLAQSANIKNLAYCTGPGWQIQNGFCYPFASADATVTGWRLP